MVGNSPSLVFENTPVQVGVFSVSDALDTIKVITNTTDLIGWRLGFTERVKVVFVDDTDYLGCYERGSKRRPVISLNLQLIKKEAEEKSVSYEHELELTYVHELAHAFQDVHGLLDEQIETEDRAELFAHNWVRYKDLSSELLRPFKPQSTFL